MGLYCAIPIDWIKGTVESMGAYEIMMGQTRAASEASHYPPEDEEDTEDFYDACWDFDEEEPSEYDNESAVQAFKSAFENTIQELCPMRTGYLRSSCHCEVSDDIIECFADAEYAQYVEYGTYKMAPQPYFEPAILAGLGAFIAQNNSLVEQYERDIERITEDAIADVLYNAADWASLVLILIIAMLVAMIIELILSIFSPMWDDLQASIAATLLQSIDIIIE